jgi:hypothetical protein
MSNNKFFSSKKTQKPIKFVSDDETKSWERWAETAFCALLQNPAIGSKESNEEIVAEAAAIADRFLTMARERQEPHSTFEDEESTGVFLSPSPRGGSYKA